jgi:hypothetical protein
MEVLISEVDYRRMSASWEKGSIRHCRNISNQEKNTDESIMLYSTNDETADNTNPAALSTPTTQRGPRTSLASEEASIERRFGALAAGVTFRSCCVGSMFGVVESWNMGANGDPSKANIWSLYPCVGSWNILHPL